MPMEDTQALIEFYYNHLIQNIFAIVLAIHVAFNMLEVLTYALAK